MHPTSQVIFVLALVLGGCSSTGRDISGRDHGAVLPAMRAILDLRGDPLDDATRPITALEFDISGADGDLTRSGVETGDYRLLEGGIAMRLGRKVRDKIRIVGIFGVGFTRIDLVERSGLPFVDDNDTEPGIRLGFELQVRVTDWLWWHGRVASLVLPFELASTQSEIGFVIGQPEGIGFMVGYKDWRFDDSSSGLQGVGEVDLDVNGLFLGMELRF